MKIPLQLKCQKCNSVRPRKVPLKRTSIDFVCERCGQWNLAVESTDVTVGRKLLLRAYYELKEENDYWMAIVLAATAFDAELSRLFRKWTKIEAFKTNRRMTGDQIDKMLRGFRNISDKIEKVCKLMHCPGIDHFVKSSPELWNCLRGEGLCIETVSVARFFKEHLFWPRNSILHDPENAGSFRCQASEQDPLVSDEQVEAEQDKHWEKLANKCCKLVEVGLRILLEMDKAKQSSL